MATLRGGATQTEAVENINAMRTGVRNTAEPLRQNAMQEVNVGRTQIVPLENLSALLDDAAQQLNAGGQVRSMRGLEGRTLEQIDDVFAHPELYAPGSAGRPLPRLGEIADQAGQRADEGIDTQMFLRDEAARARTVAEDLRAQGYAPLDITPVVRRMRELAREALPNTGRRLLFSRYADMLEQAAAESGGIIYGAKVHMAKRELGDFVASVLGQSDPSAIQRGTSMMAGDVQNAIDAAFNAAAPGTPWAEYNRVFSGGMRGVEQQDFARELTQLSPVRFENVMRGGDIDFVRQHLPNDFDINSVLTPSQRETAQRLNRGISADLDVTNTGLRALGSEQGGSLQIGAQNRVSEAIEPGFTPTTRAIFNLTGRVPGVSGGGIAAEQTARQYAQNMSQNTMRSLVPALASAPAAARLLPVRSTNYMTARAVSNLDPITQQMLAQAAQRNMTGGLINTPAAEYYAPPPGQIIVGYGLTISGQRYPIYAPPGAAQ